MDIHAAPCPSLPNDSSYEHLLFTSAQPEGCQTYSASSTSRQRLPESHLNFMLGYPGHSALQLTIATQDPASKDCLDLKYGLKIALSCLFFFLFSFSIFSLKSNHSRFATVFILLTDDLNRQMPPGQKSHEKGELKPEVEGSRV